MAEYLSRIWDRLLDALLGSAREKSEAEKISSAPRELFSSGNVSAALPYRHPDVRRGIWLFKYKGNRAAAEACAEAIWELMLEELEEERLMNGAREILLVPMPSSGKKKRARGFNQTQIIGKIIAKRESSGMLLYREDVLYKIKDTESQMSIKDRKLRLENVKDTMRAHPERASGKTIFLIDDITTTGATFKEACRALRAAGAAKILCFAAAH